jgi:hypothetical protein
MTDLDSWFFSLGIFALYLAARALSEGRHGGGAAICPEGQEAGGDHMSYHEVGNGKKTIGNVKGQPVKVNAQRWRAPCLSGKANYAE